MNRISNWVYLAFFQFSQSDNEIVGDNLSNILYEEHLIFFG